jgi:hypothetical protein
MSAVGSQVVANAPTDDAPDPERSARNRELALRLRTALGRQDEIQAPDVDELSYAEERTDVTKWLAGRGREASAATVTEVVARYRRRSDGAGEESSVPTVFVSGRRSR